MTIERVLRKSGQGLYLLSDGSLGENFDQAERFDSFGAAAHACRRHGLTDMELVLRLEPDHEIISPIA